MLCLSRFKDEKIKCPLTPAALKGLLEMAERGEQPVIEVCIVAVRGSRVVVGMQAPACVPVIRDNAKRVQSR